MSKIIIRPWVKTQRYPTSGDPVVDCDLFSKQISEFNYKYEIRVKPGKAIRRPTIAIPADVAIPARREKHFGGSMKGRLSFVFLLENLGTPDRQCSASELPKFQENHVRRGKFGHPDYVLMDTSGNIVNNRT